eukprot:78252_1
MALYEDIKNNNNNNNNNNEDEKNEINSVEESKHRISIKKELIAMNGKKYPSEKVFVEALKYLKSEAQKYFRKLKIGKIKDSQIQWILTVPAIWNDAAKNQMREWATIAGLINKTISN